MNKLINRVLRAAKLDATLYEEVEADKGAMGQAVAVVVLSSVSAGLAHAGGVGIGGLFIGIVVSLISWLVWAYLIYLIGTKIAPEPQTSSSPGELLRTVGFASSPGLVRILGIVPELSQTVSLAATVWMFVAMIIAVKHALDYTGMWRPVLVCLAGWAVQVVIAVILFSLLVPVAARMG